MGDTSHDNITLCSIVRSENFSVLYELLNCRECPKKIRCKISRWVRLTYLRLHMHQSPKPGHHTGQAAEDSEHYSVWGKEYPIPRADMPGDAPSFPPTVGPCLLCCARENNLCALPSDPLPPLATLFSPRNRTKPTNEASLRVGIGIGTRLLRRCRGSTEQARPRRSCKAGGESIGSSAAAGGDRVPRAAPAAANRQPSAAARVSQGLLWSKLT